MTTVESGGELNDSYYGVSDMDGNVAEWTEGKLGNWARIERGSSWKYGDQQIGKNFRFFNQPTTQAEHNGLRVARKMP